MGIRPLQLALEAVREHGTTLRSIGITSAARAYAVLLTLVSLVLTVRWLGPEGRGVVVVVVAWATVAANAGSLSLWQVAVHRGTHGHGKEWLSPLLGALSFVCVISTIIGWSLVALLYAFGSNTWFSNIPSAALALGLAAMPLMIWELYSNSLLSVVGKIKILNLNLIVSRSTGVVAMAVGIKILGLGIYGFLAGFFVTELMIASVGFATLAKDASGKFLDGLKELSSLIRDGLKTHLQIVGALLYSSVDILLVHHFEGASAAAIYQFASALFLALLLVPQSAVLALQARVASSSLAESWREYRTVVAIVTAFMTFVAAAGWALAPALTTLLATDEFAEAGCALRIFMLAIPPASLVWMMTVQWLVRGRFLTLGAIYLTMGITSVILNLFFIPRYGAQGAAISAVIMWYAIPLIPTVFLIIAAQRESVRDRSASVSSPARADFVPEPPPFP